MKKARCLIIVDGSNFYFKLKSLKLNNTSRFNYSKFAKYLAGKDKIIKSVYYIGKIKTTGSKKTKEMHANQQRLFAHLKKHNFTYSLGYLLKSDKN